MKKLLIVLCFTWIIPQGISWQTYLDMFPSAREMARCESNINAKALNPKDPVSRSVGLLQFKDKTFYGWAKSIELVNTNGETVDADIKNPFHQIIVFRWAEENNLLKHWSCKKILLRGNMAFLFNL